MVKRTDKRGRGNMEELALKFFAYFENREKFKHSVKEFLNDYMAKKTKKFDNQKELESLFEQVISTIAQALPAGIARSDRPNTTPLALAEAVLVGVADVIHSGKQVDNAKLLSVLDDAELRKFMVGGTNSIPKLLGRIKVVSEAIRA